MIRFILRCCIISVLFSSSYTSAVVTLNGKDLTIDQALSVANGEKVEISVSAEKQVKQGFELLMEAAREGKTVYGLTVGVGLNKDHSLFNANGELSQEVLTASKNFNINTLRAHQAGVGKYMPEKLIRLTMVTRLNTLLTGHTGAQWHVAELYRDFLNNHITPLVPAIGTVGEADITLASHIGAVMIGEWKAQVKGKVVSGKDALKSAKLTQLDAQGKDALSIISTNAVSVAYSIMAYHEAEQLLQISPTLYAMSLEALNGNVAPILPQTLSIRPFSGLQESGTQVRNALEGSYLWQTDKQRPLQDPLSFRTTVYTLAEANNALAALKEALLIQINHSDDNPAVMISPSDEYNDSPQVQQYFNNNGGAVIPTSNFEALPIAFAVQRLSIALTQVAHNSVMRTLHLADDHFTGLTRFAAAKGNQGHAFGAIQKPFVVLQTKNIQLAMPVSYLGQPMAGTIEDTYSNNMLASKNLEQIAVNTQYIYAFELLHAAQLRDLRVQENNNIQFGKQTTKLYQAYRNQVSFTDKDRAYTQDIEKSRRLIADYRNQ